MFMVQHEHESMNQFIVYEYFLVSLTHTIQI